MGFVPAHETVYRPNLQDDVATIMPDERALDGAPLTVHLGVPSTSPVPPSR
jgi:hypothetical protein